MYRNAILILPLLFSPALALSAPHSQACGPARLRGPEIDFMIASIALVQDPDSADPLAHQLCKTLNSVTKEVSRSHPGYTDVTLSFDDQDCTESLMITEDGRIGKDAGNLTCTDN